MDFVFLLLSYFYFYACLSLVFMFIISFLSTSIFILFLTENRCFVMTTISPSKILVLPNSGG